MSEESNFSQTYHNESDDQLINAEPTTETIRKMQRIAKAPVY